MEAVPTTSEGGWTSVDIWGALIEFDPQKTKSENIDSIVQNLSMMVQRPLGSDEEAKIRDLIDKANPVFWELRIAGPSEDERKRVQGEIFRILKPV